MHACSILKLAVTLIYKPSARQFYRSSFFRSMTTPFLIACLVSMASSSGNPLKHRHIAGPSSESMLIYAINHGTGNFVHVWLTDNDLLLHALRRLMPTGNKRGSDEARSLFRTIQGLEGGASWFETIKSLTSIADGPCQRFISKVYRGKGQLNHYWKRSLFIDAKPDAPLSSDLRDGLQMLRDYVALITSKDMPLAEYLPPQFREPLAYKSLLAPTQPFTDWKKLSLVDAAASLCEARRIIPDPLCRVKSFLFAPGLAVEGEWGGDLSKPIRGRFQISRNRIVDTLTGRAIESKPGVTILPHIATVLELHVLWGETVCDVHWPSRTQTVPIPDGATLAAVVYNIPNRAVLLLMRRADRTYEQVQVEEDPKAEKTVFGENLTSTLRFNAETQFVMNRPGVFSMPSNDASLMNGRIQHVRNTDTYLVLDESVANAFDILKRKMADFKPKSLLDARQKLEGTTDIQRQLAEAFFTTDRALAWDIIKKLHGSGSLSPSTIEQLYRKTFP